MKYQSIRPGIFQARPNRFIAHVEIDGRTELCHVKNTGRCRELLVPGVRVWCEESSNPARKTRYDLVKVEKNDHIINMDSQAPNIVAREWVERGGLGFVPEEVRAEVRNGDSRFDLYFRHGGRDGFMEVKGVTLEQDGHARFPDAPTERGAKHVRRLTELSREGVECYILFVVQMDYAVDLSPNHDTDPAFSQALIDAHHAGVHILATRCRVTEIGLDIDCTIPVII